jgi:hypothetical protein
MSSLPYKVLLESSDGDLLAGTVSVRQTDNNAVAEDTDAVVLCFTVDASVAKRVMHRADDVIRGECSHSDFIKAPQQLVNYLRRSFADDADEELIDFITQP